MSPWVVTTITARKRLRNALPFVFVAHLAALASVSTGLSAPEDPAARGLDIFLHAPLEVAPGTMLPVSVLSYGFPQVTRAVPLAHADIEAGWDPETLDGTSVLPPSVKQQTDAEGRASLLVAVPEGYPKELKLLIAVRHGGHVRTQELTVKRVEASSVELFTTDSRVVPGSTISAWVRATQTRNHEPLAKTKVVIELMEGGVARHAQEVETDDAGMAMLRVPIPRIDEPLWTWNLNARVARGTSATTTIALSPRQETPGTPTVSVEMQPTTPDVLAGDAVPFVLRLRDATGQVIPNHEVRYWIGQKGLELPKATDKKAEEEWLKISTLATSDGAGEVHGITNAPTLVKAAGTSINLVMRTFVEGHALSARTSVSVGAPTSDATLTPEASAIVPGLAQSVYLHVLSGHGEGVVGEFLVTGDGLSQKVTTDATGSAEIHWNAPLGVGAFRGVGPCASGIAAAVMIRPTHEIPALAQRKEPFQVCVPVDRDAEAIVRATPPLAHPGETVKVTVDRARGTAASKAALSVLASAREASQTVSAWVPTGKDSTTLTLPADAAMGSWTLSSVTPEAARASHTIGAHVFVAPRILPMLTVKRTGGRAAPMGKVEIEAEMTDGHGKPLVGTVAAVVTDAFGGGHVVIDSLDTRLRLCRSLGARDQCDALLEGDAKVDPRRRDLFASLPASFQGPLNDPGSHASKDLDKAFGEVLRSLEGAVFESTQSPEKLMDVRRRENGRWVWNPELFTLVTDAITDPPRTPGGEPLALADLVAVDPQVTFDNVARRITRLKLFRVLAAVRNYRREKQLDPDEPVWKDPNALLRRVFREHGLEASLLLDPWGGTIQFSKTNAAPVPFLSVVRGYDLRAPGPDGLIGTADDVRDPFERVVRSGTPYAAAVQEDRIVDAKWDMEVSDNTVTGWQSLFDELTGTTLGAGGLGLSGYGEGGGGSGSGIGLGKVGTIGHGAGRGTSGIATGDAYFSPPVRTDANGKAHIVIPLGAVETTWRVAFVGVPDHAATASTTIDIPAEVPLSSQVEAGATWVRGDTADVRIRIRNRTKDPVNATVEITRGGVLADKSPTETKVVTVAPHGMTETVVRAHANATGHAELTVKTSAAGLAEDVLTHGWDVIPPGEKRVFSQVAWVDGERALGLELDTGYELRDAPDLVLSRGYTEAVAWALDSLEPERQSSLPALLDALETAQRVRAWALTRKGAREHALADIAASFEKRAEGRYRMMSKGSTRSFTESARFDALTHVVHDPSSEATCPPTYVATFSNEENLDPLRVLPAPTKDPLPCWGVFVAEASRGLLHAGSTRLATFVLALAEHPEHAALYASVVARLRSSIELREDGTMSGPSGRADRALVIAALLRSVKVANPPATADVLFARLSRMRDANGGYGSSEATLAVTQALLASQLEGHGVTRVHVMVPPSEGVPAYATDVIVPEDGSVRVPLSARVLDVIVKTEGPGLVADLERPVLRLWSRPPPPMSSPVNMEIVWPAEARAGHVDTLRVMLRHSLPQASLVDVRIPLPPGVSLAEAIGKGSEGAIVSEIQGVLALRWAVDRSVSVIDVPVRFALTGAYTVPEATARIAKESMAPTTAPARVLSVR